MRNKGGRRMSMKCFCGAMMAPAVVDAYHTGLERDFEIHTQQCPVCPGNYQTDADIEATRRSLLEGGCHGEE